MAKSKKRPSRKGLKGTMKAGTCRKVKGGKFVCKLKNGKVRFKGTNIYKR